MAVVYQAFKPHLLHKMLDGEKVCTFRKRRRGRVGDTIRSSHMTRKLTIFVEVKLTTQIKTTAELVAKYLYRYEGFKSPDEFIAEHTQIKNEIRKRWGYPPKEYDPKEPGWVNWFADRPMPKYLWRKLLTRGNRIQMTRQKTLKEMFM